MRHGDQRSVSAGASPCHQLHRKHLLAALLPHCQHMLQLLWPEWQASQWCCCHWDGASDCCVHMLHAGDRGVILMCDIGGEPCT